MAKKYQHFPASCCGCKYEMFFMESVSRVVQGTMFHPCNHYCLAKKKAKKIGKRNVTTLRPADCPIREQYPIEYNEEQF